MSPHKKNLKLLFSLPVIVAALGYFVDIYDLLLFSIVRIPSLTALGYTGKELLSQGETLLRWQMMGLLLGGVIWGIMGDKKGRLSVLFGSILLYSLANIANGFVTSVEQYKILRFISGIGLAGELGAGVTLVSESLPIHLRGYATTIIACIGLMGAVVANLTIRLFDDWQLSYYIGGGLGLLLLLARVSVFESGIFLKAKEKAIGRGDFFQLFKKKQRFIKFMGCIFNGLPIWFAIGILITFAPEIAIALNIDGKVASGDAVMYSYIGLTVGDLISGFASQALGSRKKVIFIFILLTLCGILFFLFMPIQTVSFFYLSCFLLGISIGYWALFVTVAAEQFGTNLRATVATSVPNFIRGMVVPMTLAFKYLRDDMGLGVIQGALWIGLTTIVIAYIALQAIDETFGRDLNFEEED